MDFHAEGFLPETKTAPQTKMSAALWSW